MSPCTSIRATFLRPTPALLVLSTLLWPAGGCVIRFTAPVEPPLPTAPRPPAAPKPSTEPAPIASIQRDELVGAINARTLRRSSIALTGLTVLEDVPGAEAAHFGLVRRLLEARGPRVLDLRHLNEIGAMAERRRNAELIGYRGRLDRMLWVRDFIKTQYVLFVDPISVQNVERQLPHRYRFEDGVLDAYETSRSEWASSCRATVDAAESASASSKDAWVKAEVEHRASLPWYESICTWPCRNVEFPTAQRAHAKWLHDAESRARSCSRALVDPAALRAKAGAAARPTVSTVHVADARFRMIEVPGGRAVMAGRVVREATSAEAALEALLDGLVGQLTTGKERSRR